MKADILQQLGLTKREVEVYTTLLKLGEVPVAKLLKATGAHPQVIYRAIDSLVAKKLVLTSRRKHRQSVRAEDPRMLESLERERLEAVQEAIPDLLKLQAATPDSIVRVSQGNDAVKRVRKKLAENIDVGGIMRIIAGSGDQFYRAVGDDFLKIDRVRIRRKITRLLVSYKTQKEGLKQDPSQELSEFRYIDAPFPVPASIVVGKTFVSIQIWAKEPVVLEIESPEIVEAYTHQFTLLWRLAKP